MKKDFQSLVNAVIPLLPITKKAEVEEYVQCLIMLYSYLTRSRRSKGIRGRNYTRANCAAFIHENPDIGLRFLAELENLGFIYTPLAKNKKKSERYLVPTEFLTQLLVEHEPFQNTVRYPIKAEEKQEDFQVRIKAEVIDVIDNESAFAVSNTQFTINDFILELLRAYPVYTEKDKEFISYHRTVTEARKYQGRLFKFPYFLCSRGRLYNEATVGFSPQGADHEKALILPNYAEVLTENGVKALRETILGYAEQDWCDSTIISFARNPERYRDEWIKADKPFCFMASAYLLSMWYNDPEQPIPAFIPLDGRCSGLQHWSAVLGSDAITDRLGMEKEEAQDGLDMYEYIASEWGKEVAPEYAHLITRKLCKKPVMTFAYSATRMSSMDNVHEILGEESAYHYDKLTKVGGWEVVKPGLDRKTCAELGSQLFNKTNDVLQPMVAGVGWLKESVQTIMLKTEDTTIVFPTYDGFLGKQVSYMKNEMQVRVTDSLGKRHSVTLQVPQLDMYGQKIPSIKKAQSGIGPNLIHAYDATHLRMVALDLFEQGIQGIWIHDSFAVHVNHRAVLYESIIENFIELYSRNHLLILKKWWEDAYQVELSEPPAMGSWKVETLRDCLRFFE